MCVVFRSSCPSLQPHCVCVPNKPGWTVCISQPLSLWLSAQVLSVISVGFAGSVAWHIKLGSSVDSMRISAMFWSVALMVPVCLWHSSTQLAPLLHRSLSSAALGNGQQQVNQVSSFRVDLGAKHFKSCPSLNPYHCERSWKWFALRAARACVLKSATSIDPCGGFSNDEYFKRSPEL